MSDNTLLEKGMYFSYEQDAGIQFHETLEAAEKSTVSALAEYRDLSGEDSGWPENVTDICFGIVLKTVVETSRIMRPPESEIDDDFMDQDGNCWINEWAWIADYELKEVTADQTAKIAELEAEVERLRDFVRSIDGFQTPVVDAHYLRCTTYIFRGREVYFIENREGDLVGEGANPLEALESYWSKQNKKALSPVQSKEDEK